MTSATETELQPDPLIVQIGRHCASIMAPEASDEVSSSISAVATQCRIRLQQCLHLQPLMQYEWAENRLAEFNLWAAGAGAFAGERASLDAKLALQIDTQTFVISILSLLLGCVEKCRDTGECLLVYSRRH